MESFKKLSGLLLYQSTNRGDRWSLIPGTQNAPVIGLALQQEGNRVAMYGFRASQPEFGIYRSVDGGKSWERWGTGTTGLILYMAIAPNNPQIFYAVNENNAVFQSQNGGKTWKTLS